METNGTEPITLADLKALHDQVQRRFGEALGYQWGRYEALGQRYDRVAYQKLRPAAEALASDLRGLLSATLERLQYCALRGATDVAGFDPVIVRNQAAQAAQAAANAMRPKETPVELVRRLADRGIMVQAEDGTLRVTPADALTEADRVVLTANKPALLETLGRSVAVL